MLTAMRRASSRVSRFAAARRPGSFSKYERLPVALRWRMPLTRPARVVVER